jgi:hypothetical protein
MKTIVNSLVMLFAFVILFSTAVNATGEGDETNKSVLQGKVIDNNTNESLAGVKVVLIGTDKITYSDLEGKFEFKNVKTGNYSLGCTYISYEEVVIEKVVVDSDCEKPVEVKLNSN